MKHSLTSATHEHYWLRNIAQSRFFWLLITLVAMVLFSTEVPATTVGRIEDGAGMMAVLLGTTIAARGGSQRFWQMLALNSLTLSLWFLSIINPGAAIRIICFLLFIFSLSCAVCFTLAYVLRAGVITLDHILGAICAYVLIAMIFSTFFMCAWVIDHDAFKGIDPNTQRPWADLFYFSCTTLSTVGYGDIYPGSHRARSLVIIEQFLGTFYIAVLISRLTGLYTAGKPPIEEESESREQSTDAEVFK